MINPGKLVVIEGLWQLGKSTLAGELVRMINAVFLPEPDHKPENLMPGEIEPWYEKQFRSLELTAKSMKESGQSVVMERSMLSLLSYVHASEQRGYLAQLRTSELAFSPDILIVIAPSYSHLEKLAGINEEKYAHIRGLNSEKYFAHRYHQFLLKNCQLLDPKRLIIIQQSDLQSRCRELSRRIVEEIKKDALIRTGIQ